MPPFPRFVPLAVILAVGAAFPTPAAAQLLPPTAGLADKPSAAADGSPSEATEQVQRFRVGAVIKARRGACRGIVATVAVPIECDEQSARVVEEDFTPHVEDVTFRDVVGGIARQMVITIPYLGDNEEARAVLTYEVRTRTTPPPTPAEAAAMSIPSRPPKGLRTFLKPSPFIESKNARVKRVARRVVEEAEAELGDGVVDWERLQAVYDHVIDSIRYVEGPDTSAMTTLREGTADCHGRSALFIALCRSLGVPARMVWVHNHCYPEFYLESPDGEGRWLPAESAGTRAFGAMPVARTIMQKGDSFRVPERRGERFHYAAGSVDGTPERGSGKPKITYVREVAP
ncbi:MAG: transglutaminase domain-containing protein [Planctomycetota bacterium]